MADIAVIFGWRLADMDPMSVPELMRWHAHALRRGPRMEDD
ncbi:putative phage protein [Profundibacterium mesophilum KAUST100406-0324]|uniref:Phage protein n=1 Tax=Profundibacterium mesophilum KAUST100406-0324 TaxID=1037889 RepID=A0A921NW31_9RHOB|nr:putative phage protein [Profundibacterium mesophilum KAUST100406-0324]